MFPLVVNAPPNIAGRYSNTAIIDWAPLDSGFGGIDRFPVPTMITLCGHIRPSIVNGEFSTLSLVEAADTPPFFHKNSAATIEEAIRFYNSDGLRSKHWSASGCSAWR